LSPLAGALTPLAFAPHHLHYCVLLGLTGFYLLCQGVSRRRAMANGYGFGLGLFGTGIWWTYISIHDFGGADPVSATLLTALLVAVLALFFALTAFIVSCIADMPGVWWRILAAAWAWVAVEYVRGYWLLNGFPWLQIAYSQLATPLAGYAPVGGVYATGFLLAASAFALGELIQKRLPGLTALAFIGLVWGGGAVLKQIEWTRPDGDAIKITLIQGNIAQNEKWLPENLAQSLNRYQQLTEAHWSSDVIIWPETAIPAFHSEVNQHFLAPLSAQAREHGVDVVVSLPVESDGGEYYNSVMTLGERERFYHKTHLLPFGEYLPLQPLSGWVLDKLQIPLGNFKAGATDQTLLEAGGHAFITTICYEAAFGNQVIGQLDQAAYLVNVTNDAWFGDSAQPHQHMQMAQMRALETGRYLARATNTGLSGFVAPDGRLISQAPMFETAILTAHITPMTGVTPYARLGDAGVFAVLTTLVGLVAGLIRYRRHFRAG